MLIQTVFLKSDILIESRITGTEHSHKIGVEFHVGRNFRRNLLPDARRVYPNGIAKIQSDLSNKKETAPAEVNKLIKNLIAPIGIYCLYDQLAATQ